jgi:2-polyprenyl-6-hydroxyphenyl methylase/3-demethylubiquinone-9 3-methyltransferase
MESAEQTCTVYFDGACPLCRREIAHYRERAGAESIRWVDVASAEAAALGEDLDRDAALARLHVRGADGRLFSGAAAFAAIWQRLPAYAWLGRVASQPPVRWLLEGGYRGFLAVRRLWRPAPAALPAAVPADLRTDHAGETRTSVIGAEIARFERLSTTWWNAQGPMRPLHVTNALRVGYLLERIAGHFGRDADASLEGLRVLDVGCGAGLVCEPLARRGARVTGIDAAAGNIAAARLHAQPQGLAVDYRHGDPLAALHPEERFDVVLLLEVVEHVHDVPAFVAAAAQHVAPGGLLVVSTIDRTAKSFVFAILGAEYLLRVLPRGTHRWRQFVRPAELESAARAAGLVRTDQRGMRYLPLVHRASWTRDTAVNYIATFARRR